MRRFLLSCSSTSWFLRKISPNHPRFYCSSSPSFSTPDSVDPKIPDSNESILQTVTESTKDDEFSFSSKDAMFGELNQKIKTDPFLANLEYAGEMETLLYKRHDPNSTFWWYRNDFQGDQPDWMPKNSLVFCVVLHILATSSVFYGPIRQWLGRYVASDLCPAGISLYHLLLKVESWENMAKGFKFSPSVYSLLLTVYARADRCRDTIDCLNAMLTKPILPDSVAVNAVLRLLIGKVMIFEAKKLYADVVSKGVSYDCETVRIMMNLCLKEGNVEESHKYFVDAIGHPPVQYAMSFNYTNAIDFACNKLDSEGACVLLWQMKSLGITPSEETFTNVICTCVKKGNIDLALKVNEEIRNSGLSLKTSVFTSLMNGFILQGDLSCALELFNKMSEFGLCPDQDAYAVIIEGCGNHGNMDKAVELNNQMKLAGIPSNGEIVPSLIKGFLKARMPDEGVKLLNEAKKDGIAYKFTYNDVLGWFRKEGMTDEA